MVVCKYTHIYVCIDVCSQPGEYSEGIIDLTLKINGCLGKFVLDSSMMKKMAVELKTKDKKLSACDLGG